jgi:hypothetical protein
MLVLRRCRGGPVTEACSIDGMEYFRNPNKLWLRDTGEPLVYPLGNIIYNVQPSETMVELLPSIQNGSPPILSSSGRRENFRPGLEVILTLHYGPDLHIP